MCRFQDNSMGWLSHPCKAHPGHQNVKSCHWRPQYIRGQVMHHQKPSLVSIELKNGDNANTIKKKKEAHKSPLVGVGGPRGNQCRQVQDDMQSS